MKETVSTFFLVNLFVSLSVCILSV